MKIFIIHYPTMDGLNAKFIAGRANMASIVS